MDQATARTFHSRLLHAVSTVPTRTGAALTDTVNAHGPDPLEGGGVICAGGRLDPNVTGTCIADYPCSTTKVIAGALRLDIPTTPGYGAHRG